MMVRKLQLSLRTAIFIVFFIFASVTIVSVVYIQFYRENDTLNVMSERIINTRGEAVGNALNYYIYIPQQANSIATLFIKTLDAGDRGKAFTDISNYLYKVMTQMFTRDSLLSSIAFGSVEGNYVGFNRDLESNWTFQIKKNADTDNKLVFYRDGTDTSPVMYTVDNYNLFERPWFSAVNQAHTSMWSNAYRDVNSESGVSISFSSPVLDRNGAYIGVVSSDLRLSRLSRFLTSLTTAEHSLIYLVNDKQQIIATSAPELIQNQRVHGLAEQSGADLPLVSQSEEPVVKATAEFLRKDDGTINKIEVDGTRYFCKVIKVGDSQNLKGWHMVVLVSENELLGKLSGYRSITILIAVLVFLVSCFIAHRILSVVVNPLKKIAEQAPDIALRRKIERNQGWSFQEVNSLDSALHQMSNDLDSAFALLEDQINIDSETGLLTRKGLLAALTQAKPTFQGVIGIVSLSNVQTMINNLGSSYATRYLQAFIDFISRHFPEDVVLARDAVDRFIICCPVNMPEQLETYTASLMSLMQEAEGEYENTGFVFTGHTGLVTCPDDTVPLSTAITHANIALQSARQSENVHTRVYDDLLREQALNNITMLNHLYGAIPNQELFLVYQPIVLLDSTTVKEAECLLRWNNPELGMVRPDKLIAVAEESGFIIQLGRWIINQACGELAAQIGRGFCPVDFKLHINVSIIELTQPDFCDYLLSTIAAAGLKNSNICIEITETSMIKGDNELKETIATLRKNGVTLSIDDFGSGFSSLSYLHKLEFDALKIDRNFVMDVLKDKKNESIISAVILLAKGFNVPLIAEGVETVEVAEKLASMGCEKAQGYYFCRPMKFEDWPEEMLDTGKSWLGRSANA
ncbi:MULTISPECIES: EAL domain-containing protein [Cedecea]|uniref:Cyclic diguanylate phosphodiesterase domain protein n=1 Tax=Cedecea davisae DSM 4568 TaxID=566551 RepID=S3IWA5_9ENTR|nr:MULTISPECIES: EAL domain-containing protein [Cedecea]EPF18003.1 cyclic diguanylate phosphodiesterase domain protein [Cedecea davisae DSM 4568]QIX94382.1 EAL domain-containing protein [Cedecea sp. FDAARGOS_727]SUX28318.1 Putative cyclic di-GMP phosphodiesterase YliE [Cedecea davisae]